MLPHHVNHFVYSGFSRLYLVCVAVCRFTCHEKCMNHLVISCPYLALTKITVSILALPPSGFSDGVLYLCRNRWRTSGGKPSRHPGDFVTSAGEKLTLQSYSAVKVKIF